MRFVDLAFSGPVFLAAALGAAGARGGEEALKVMTFNIRYATADDGHNSWSGRQDLVLETIRQFDPDLLGTQEVLYLQREFLAQKLPDYQLLGVGRDDGKRQGEFSPVLLKAKRFEVLDWGTFWLSETPDVPGSTSWDSALPRIVTWAKLRDRQAGGREIYFLNTHWDNRGNQAQLESGQLIRKWLNEHARGSSVILTGDFNVTETHAGLAALLAPGNDPRLVDVFRQVHPERGEEEATFHVFSGRRRGRRIDFILASPPWIPVRATIDHTSRDGHYPSDHYPVTAVLRYPSQ